MRLLPAANACLAVLLLSAAAQAGPVYRWVDEQGGVHFGNVPPPGRHAVEQALPAPRQVAPASTAAAAAAPEAAAKGPPRVVITEREEVSLGGPLHAVRGTVKNQGGAVARGVVIAIRVVEPIQGEECLTDEIRVAPATLAPGEKGTFSAEFDNPCFHGPTQSDLRIEWD